MIKENLADFTKTIYHAPAQPAASRNSPPAAPRSSTPQGVQIPGSIPRLNADGTGTYYLYLYLDDQRVVSELNEDNNIVQGGPVIVRAPSFGFLGLQTPCSGMTCDKTGTMPLAWQFTNGSLAVDTASDAPAPEVLERVPCVAARRHPGYPNTAPAASSAPNAADITSGNSGWQYFPNPGMSRPQYLVAVQLRRDRLPRGSCYTMWVEIPSTGQVVGADRPDIQALRAVLDYAAVGRGWAQGSGIREGGGVEGAASQSRPPVVCTGEGEAGASALLHLNG